jgi:exonuclease SbcD
MGGDWSSFGRPGHAVVGDVVLCLLPYLDRHWLRAQPGFESIPDAEVFGVLGEQFLAIAGGLYAQARQAYPDKAAVLVCHQTLAGASMSETQQAFLGDLSLVVDARALAAIGFEAVVAGHLHRHQIVVPGDRPILYPGSIERVDFGEEREAKGFIAADVGPGWFEWEFVATPARRFVTLRGDEATDIPAGIQLDGSIVRVLDLDPSLDPVAIRGHLETLGAFEVVEIRRRPTEAPESAGGLSESLSAEQALAAYFADEPDAEALVERGRAILAEAAA